MNANPKLPRPRQQSTTFRMMPSPPSKPLLILLELNTPNSRITLMWLNFMRGLLKDCSWLLAWTILMNTSLTDNYQSERLTQAMIRLRNIDFIFLPLLRTGFLSTQPKTKAPSQ